MITLNHGQTQRLRNYIDVANSHLFTFNRCGFSAELVCTIDDYQAVLCLQVAATPARAVELMRTNKMRYRSVDYHHHDTHPTATYCIESFVYEVMVIARGPVEHVAEAGKVIEADEVAA